MSVWAILSLLSSIFIFGLGSLVLIGKPRKKLSYVFFALCFSIALWLLATFLVLSSPSEENAIFWDRIVYLGVVFIPILIYHFGLVFSSAERKNVVVLIIGYISSCFFAYISQNKLFLDNLYRYDWGVHSQARIFHDIFLAFFFIYILLFFINLYFFYKNQTGLVRAQTKYLFIAYAIIFAGSVGFLPAYGINVYPFAYFFV